MVQHPPSFGPRSESELRRTSPASSIRNSGFPPSFRRRSEPELRRACRFQVSRLRSDLEASRNYGGQAGFTLVELMTVIAIIAILAGLILGVSGYATRKADKSRAIAEMEKIKGALEEYRLQYGQYPSITGSMTSVSFVWLRTRLTNTMQNAVADLQFTDPWGNGFYYANSAKYVYMLSSWGPDLTDTNDNITAGLAGM